MPVGRGGLPLLAELKGKRVARAAQNGPGERASPAAQVREVACLDVFPALTRFIAALNGPGATVELLQPRIGPLVLSLADDAPEQLLPERQPVLRRQR